MSDTQKPTLPDSMIDKAARVLHRFDCVIPELAESNWNRGIGTDEWIERARAALAAALDGCEVAEDWIVTGLPGGGYPPYRHVWEDDEAGAREFVRKVKARELAAYDEAWISGPTLLHRWRVTVVVTPAQEETIDGV